MRRILVPVDGSKNSIRGLKKAIRIAKEGNTKIVVLHVVKLPPAFVLRNLKTRIKADYQKDGKRILSEAEKVLQKEGIKADIKMINGGDPGYDIVKFSQKHKFDMIVIGARGLNPIKEVFLGSVSNYVLHKSKTPVLVVK